MATDMVSNPAGQCCWPRHLPLKLAVWLALMLPPAVVAAGFDLTPTLGLTETYTDNAGLTATNREHDLITEIAPGVQIRADGDHLKLSLDYRWRELIYARESRRSGHQNVLNATGRLEAIDQWLFIDANGVISQQAISAFGPLPTANSNRNDNATETATYRLNPYIQGSMGSVADYRLGYTRDQTHAKSGRVADLDSDQWAGELKGQSGYRGLGWRIDADTLHARYTSGLTNKSDQVRASLIIRPTPLWRISVFAGEEANNYFSTDRQTWHTSGIMLDWLPSNRTQVSLGRQRRFFGDSDSFSFSHRSALTAWRLSSNRDVQLQSPSASAASSSLYDLFFNLFASQEPDPVKRAALVEQFLALNGLSGNAIAPSGFLSSRPTLLKRLDGSFAILGSRNTITFTGSRSDQQALRVGIGLPDDFETSPRIRQHGYGVSWSHLLSPTSSLTAMLTHQVSRGLGASLLETTQSSGQLIFSTQLGHSVRANLSARRTLVDGTTRYAESALVGALLFQF